MFTSVSPRYKLSIQSESSYYESLLTFSKAITEAIKCDATIEQLFCLIKKHGPSAKVELTGCSKTDFMAKEMRLHTFRRVSFTVPFPQCIQDMKDFIGPSLVLSVGSGNCLTEYLLHRSGVNVQPTDTFTTHDTSKETCLMKDSIQECTSVDAVKQHSKRRVLLMIWPPFTSSMGSDALKEFTESPSRTPDDKFILIGESAYGCTGDYALFEYLSKKWKMTGESYPPTWDCIHDYIQMYTLK